MTPFLLKKTPFITTKHAVEMIFTFKPHNYQLLKIVLGTIFPNYCLHYLLGLQKKIHTHSYTGFCRYVKKYFVDQYNNS